MSFSKIKKREKKNLPQGDEGRDDWGFNILWRQEEIEKPDGLPEEKGKSEGKASNGGKEGGN